MLALPFVNLLADDKMLALSKLRADDELNINPNVDNIMSFVGKKTLSEKKELLITSNFSSSYSFQKAFSAGASKEVLIYRIKIVDNYYTQQIFDSPKLKEFADDNFNLI